MTSNGQRAMKKVLYLGPPDFQSAIQLELGPDFTLKWVPSEMQPVQGEIGDATVWFDASMKVPLDKELLGRAPKLELVITATTGADHIDADALVARNIPLLTLRGQREVLNSLTPAAELSWLLLMACARRLRGAIHHVEKGLWEREQFPGVMLRGKTLGIIGCGRIGGWMARYAQAFEMPVLGFDPFLTSFPSQVKPTELNEVLKSSDFVSIHVPFSDQTRNLLGARELGLMRRGAVLINTSRGAIVNEAALLAGLEAGTPSALGVDVVEGEPNVTDTRLWRYAQTHPNVIVTPHIGGFSPDALDVVLRFTAQRVVKHFRV